MTTPSEEKKELEVTEPKVKVPFKKPPTNPIINKSQMFNKPGFKWKWGGGPQVMRKHAPRSR